MSKDISNTDDVIDSRDVIERIEELESELQSALDSAEDSVGQWRVRDNDHGTTREWGERVLGVYFEEL